MVGEIFHKPPDTLSIFIPNQSTLVVNDSFLIGAYINQTPMLGSGNVAFNSWRSNSKSRSFM